MRRYAPFFALLLVMGLGFAAVRFLVPDGQPTSPSPAKRAPEKAPARSVTLRDAAPAERLASGPGAETSTTDDPENDGERVVRRMRRAAPGGLDEARASARAQLTKILGEDVSKPTVGPDVLAATGVTGRVVDAHGAAIEGAAVRVVAGLRAGRSGVVMLGGVGLGGLGPDGGSGAGATSDADGRFEILGLDPGRGHEVHASLAGYLDTRKQAPALAASEVTDLGLIRLERPGAIEGVVRDEDGAPVEGARVKLGEPTPEGVQMFESMGPGGGRAMVVMRHEESAEGESDDVDIVVEGDGPSGMDVDVEMEGPPAGGATMAWGGAGLGGAFRPDVRTDAQGRFRLDEVRPGAHAVSAMHADYRHAIRRGVAVAAEKTTRIELVLGKALNLEVVVRDASGRAIEGAYVTARAAGDLSMPPGLLLPGTQRPAFGPKPPSTSAAGLVRFEGLKSTEVTVTVEMEGFIASSQALRLQDAGTSSHEVTLLVGATVAGRVVDATGAPAAGAWVRLESASNARSGGPGGMPGGVLGAEAGSAVTGARGRFEVRGVRPGAYRAQATEGSRSASHEPFAVTAGEEFDLGDLTFPAEGKVVVTVITDDDGAPIAGASARLTDGSRNPGQSISITSTLTEDDDGDGEDAVFVMADGFGSKTDADGHLELAAAVGSHTVEVSHAAYATARARVVVPATGEAQVTIALTGGGALLGTVTRDGGPADGVHVSIARAADAGGASFPTFAETDAQGGFRVDRLAAGSYLVSLASGGATAVETVEVVVDGAAEVHLDAGATGLRLRVLDASGEPARGVPVTAGHLDFRRGGDAAVGFAAASAVTDANGIVTLAGAQGSPHATVTTASGRWTFEIPAAEGDAGWDLRLPAGRDFALVGAVVDPDGAELGGATVEVTRLPMKPGGGATLFVRRELAAGLNGMFTVPDLPAGSYSVRASYPGRASASAALTVGASDEPLRLTLPAQGFLAIRPVTSDGAPARVTYWGPGVAEHSGEAQPGRAGETMVRDDLVAGEAYRIHVSAEGYGEAVVVAPATATLSDPVEVRLERE